MKLSSPAFSHGKKIPICYTCEGENISPPLHIEDVPHEAKSLALIMDDPDVPSWVREDGVYDHWIIFNMLPSTEKIAEGKAPLASFGKNTSGSHDYVGPCPPDREHRYFFTLFALDITLKLPSGITKKELEKAMEGHILEKAQLIGLYEKREKSY